MSAFPSGYHGKVLEVDLSRGRIERVPLDASDVHDYLGGRGLAARIFYDRIDPACDPLSPDNVLVIATSPLLGTNAPTAGRGHMVFKSPLTGMIGSSNCGGTWAPAFKASGYDVLVIRGKAAAPVVLEITPEQAEILPAGDLWGLDVHHTVSALAEGQAAGLRRRVLCIGPAGENKVRFAAVMNDKNRAYGRSGAGAVWGSKNLKAVRVSGREKTEIKDKEKYRSGAEQAYYLLKQAPATKRLLKELGTLGLVELIDLIDMLPHRNFQDNLHLDEDVERISGETLAKKLLERAAGCYLCPIACQRHTRVSDKRGEGPEYETTVMMGPDCAIYDLEAIALANYACNELGLDTISFGGTLACVMELYEKGILTAKDTDGLDLHFGNSRILEEMVRRTAGRQGFGDLMAEGSFRLASAFSHPELSMTVKKQEIPAYEPRASFTQALGYMTSPTGACHLKGGYAVSLAFFGGAKEIPRFSLLQSPMSIRNMHNLGILQDSLGVCRFTGFAFSLDPWARMASGVTGLDFSTAVLEEVANRVAALERLFNIDAGMTAADDTLPERFSREPIVVAGEERVIPPEAIDRLRSDYYRARGWDEEGRPAPGLIESLRIRRRQP
ncbi:MAG: aldehyde ferredoxin oxidoreductase family protein [Clostridiales bacterium]|nr:aldehyde ferredoxin oxidoreductase family protein [Clostridiales bacterium]